jgi:hypothetical protein
MSHSSVVGIVRRSVPSLSYTASSHEYMTAEEAYADRNHADAC